MIGFMEDIQLKMVSPLDINIESNIEPMVGAIIDAIRSDKRTKENIEMIATNYPMLTPLLIEIVKKGWKHHRKWLNTILTLKE
jgi:hypothetical protein